MKLVAMTGIKSQLWILCFLWIIFLTSGTSGQFDANFTLQNAWGRLETDSRSIIQCLSDDYYKYIKFSRKLDTGQGPRLPKFVQQFMQAKPVFARILFMPSDDKLNRFGAFQCKIVIEGIATEIVTLKLPPSNLAELDALSSYKVASVNDTVELEVNATQKMELPIKWKHNGVDVPSWDNLLKVDIPNVQKEDSGIYECFYEGRRKEGAHALIRLIVRGCDEDKYGADCDQDCPPCYNGGVCHDTWGVCVCPAGFTGENCEVACGGNLFGVNCSKFCDIPQENSNTDELCKSHLFCKPDPYGCSCAPGFKGSSCMENCEPGWYGADCKQPCHCAYSISNCNRITGACQGGCARGWRGNSCQIEEPPRLTSPLWLLSKTNISLTVGWRDWVSGHGGSSTDKIEYMVVFRKSEASSWEKVDSWSTEMTNTVSDLTPNTQYEVAVKCRRLGKGGEENVSPSLLIKTECGVASVDGLAREFLPNHISESAVTLTWRRPFEDPLRCALEGYYLSYYPEADETIVQAVELDAGADSVELEDLTPNTVYVIRLYAVTAVGRSKYFSELTLRTSDTVPDPVTHLECRAVDEKPSLLIVSWKAPSGLKVAIKRYIVSYTLMDRGHCSQQLVQAEDTTRRMIEANDTETTLSNLQPYSTYIVIVQARTSVGESNPVAVIGTTAESKPAESPPNVRVVSSTGRSLRFRWDPIPCEHKNGIITHYEYVVLLLKDISPKHLKLKKRSPDVPVPTSSIHVIEGLEVEIKNLEPDTEYGFMVRGVTKAGAGEFSDVLKHRTYEDSDHISPSLRTLDVEGRNETTFTVFSTTGSTSDYWEQAEFHCHCRRGGWH